MVSRSDIRLVIAIITIILFAAMFWLELHTWTTMNACMPKVSGDDLNLHELFDACNAVIFTAVGSAIAFFFVDRRNT
jgi:ABC-type uncharacterized transport system permease subunit